MSETIAADYGFTKTQNGRETTFVVHESAAFKSVAKLRGALWYGFLVFIALLVWGGSGSILAGIITFVVLMYGFKLLGKVLGKALKVKTNLGSIVVRPTTLSIGDRSYELKDVRDWHVGNPREGTLAPPSATQLAADFAARTHWFIKFHYGAQEVTAAFNLSQAQANALLNEILEAIRGQAEPATHSSVVRAST
jgi:hypothetical protein